MAGNLSAAASGFTNLADSYNRTREQELRERQQKNDEKWAPISLGVNALSGGAQAVGGILSGIGALRKPMADGGIVEPGAEPQPAEVLNPIEIWAKGLNPVYFNNSGATELGLSLQELASLPGVMSVEETVDGFLQVDPTQQCLVNAAVIAQLCKTIIAIEQDLNTKIGFIMEQLEEMQNPAPVQMASGGAVPSVKAGGHTAATSSAPDPTELDYSGIIYQGGKIPGAGGSQEAMQKQLMDQYSKWLKTNPALVPAWYKDQYNSITDAAQTAANEKADAGLVDDKVPEIENPLGTDKPKTEPAPIQQDTNLYGADKTVDVAQDNVNQDLGFAEGGPVESSRQNQAKRRKRLDVANARMTSIDSGVKFGLADGGKVDAAAMINQTPLLKTKYKGQK